MHRDEFPRAPFANAQEFMPPEYRFAGDDWSGDNAFTFLRWATEPETAADGTVTTPGVPRDLTGCSARGLLYRRALYERHPINAAIQAPIALMGTITDPTGGEFELTLAAGMTGINAQDRFDPRSRYVLRVLLTDPSNCETTIGVIPVFVL